MTLNPDFFKFVRLFHKLPRCYYQDLSDHLASYTCAAMYILMCIFLGAKSLVGNTIQCFVPKEFSSAWEDYAEQVCWVEGTYWAHDERNFPNREDRNDGRILYYQWVPLFFVGLTLFCYLPDLGWKIIIATSGAQLRSIVDHLRTVYKQTESTSRRKILQETSDFVWQILKHSERNHRCNCRPRCGSKLFICYLLYKFVNISTAYMQLFACWYFVGHSSIFFGWQLATHLFSGKRWTDTGNFPRVVFCDITLRGLGNSRAYTLQCALPVNMVNEVFFLIIWFYLAIVSSFLILSCFVWMFVILTPGSSMRLVCRYLKQSEEIMSGAEKKYLAGFVKDFFRIDGIFLLRMINREAGQLLTGQLIAHLWRLYKDDCRKRADGCSEMEGINQLTMV